MQNADRENIRRLLKRLGRDFSTEDHITFVAENTGLLQSCRHVLAAEREGRQDTIEWLKDACAESGVVYTHCIQEIGRILQLFQPGMEQDQHYAELGLTADASDEEVKRAYRRLSIKYHPDTAGNTDEETTEKFIRLTRAYHAIISGEELVADPTPATGGPPSWSYGKTKKSFSGRLSPKVVLGGALLVGALIAACLVVSEMYSRKVMLSTLHGSGAAFIPPARKGQQENSRASMTFAEKLRSNGEADVALQDAGAGGKGSEVVAAAAAEEDVFSRQPMPTIPADDNRIIDESRKTSVEEGGADDSYPEIGTTVQQTESTGDSPIAQTVIDKKPADVAGGSVVAVIPETEQPQLRVPDRQEASPVVISELEKVSEHPEKPVVPVAVTESLGPDGEEKPHPAAAKVAGLPATIGTGTVHAEKKEASEKAPPLQQTKEQLPSVAVSVPSAQENTVIQAPGKPAAFQPALEKTAPAIVHAAVKHEERQKPEDSLQKKIDVFLHEYSAAYGQKNMAGFLEFFNDDATENGKPVVDLIPTYAKLFEETEGILLQISPQKWQETAQDGIALQCRFKIELAYRNADLVHGTGEIDFRLVKDKSGMKIQQMSYSFDQ